MKTLAGQVALQAENCSRAKLRSDYPATRASRTGNVSSHLKAPYNSQLSFGEPRARSYAGAKVSPDTLTQCLRLLTLPFLKPLHTRGLARASGLNVSFVLGRYDGGSWPSRSSTPPLP